MSFQSAIIITVCHILTISLQFQIKFQPSYTMKNILSICLVLLQLMAGNFAQQQSAYAVYDANADNFILSNVKPLNGYAAYAIYSNTINQTG